MAKLDVRQNNKIEYFVDNGVSDVLTIAGFTSLDSGYTLAIGNETYTVGNGLTLGANSISWAVDTTTFGVGVHNGTLVSDSSVAGVYFKCQIEMHIV